MVQNVDFISFKLLLNILLYISNSYYCHRNAFQYFFFKDDFYCLLNERPWIFFVYYFFMLYRNVYSFFYYVYSRVFLYGSLGGMFEYVSGANFFGEIVEWLGFAVANGSLPAYSFFFFTLCNIGPRAIHHHRYVVTPGYCTGPCTCGQKHVHLNGLLQFTAQINKSRLRGVNKVDLLFCFVIDSKYNSSN